MARPSSPRLSSTVQPPHRLASKRNSEGPLGARSPEATACLRPALRASEPAGQGRASGAVAFAVRSPYPFASSPAASAAGEDRCRSLAHRRYRSDGHEALPPRTAGPYGGRLFCARDARASFPPTVQWPPSPSGFPDLSLRGLSCSCPRTACHDSPPDRLDLFLGGCRSRSGPGPGRRARCHGQDAVRRRWTTTR